MKRYNKLLLAASALAVGLASQAQAAFVTYNETSGAVTFAPQDLVAPAIVGLVAAVAATAAGFLIFLGVRWCIRMAKAMR